MKTENQSKSADFRIRKSGFTLMELLTVVSIMAIIAGTLIVLVDGTTDQASASVSQTEILEIKKAFLHFKRDTGYYPGEGPFGLIADGGAIDSSLAEHWPSHLSGATQAEREAWFQSPANFYQLFENPLSGNTHHLKTFDPNTGRGWRGPYLERFGEGYVDVGDDISQDGSGDPTAGGINSTVRSVADGYSRSPVGNAFVWRTLPSDAPHSEWGRPYFYFPDHTDGAQLVGLGKNGHYIDPVGDEDNIILLLE